MPSVALVNGRYCSPQYHTLGELDRALTAGRAALEQRAPATTGWAAAAVRLAHVHHWLGEYADALALLDRAEEAFAAAHDDPQERASWLAFVHQHRAKALFDRGDLTAARHEARTAVTLREGGDPDLLASARQTLARIEDAGRARSGCG